LGEREEQLLKAVAEANTLPTVPAVAIAILRLSHDPRVSIEKMAEAMERDPALAAKTLRFANSSYYGTATPIVSLPQALVRIGIRGAKMLALSFSLIDVCHKGGVGDFSFPAFWFHSLTTSVAARRIAGRSLRHLADQAFIGGLLADLGCPILARTFPAEYRSVDKMIRTGLRDLADTEQRLLGISHPKVSGMLLKSWRLPAELVAAVAAHHDLTLTDRDSPEFTTAALIMAASDLAEIIISGATKERIHRLATAFRDYFSFTAAHIDLILKDLGPEVQQVGAMLDVPLPPIDQLHAEAKSEMLKLALFESQAKSQASPATA
jgi:HD-like signal output (HDOD) protein